MHTKRGRVSRRPRISLLDMLVLTAAFALVLLALGFRADIGAFALFATLMLSLAVSLVAFGFRHRRFSCSIFRYASSVFVVSIALVLSLGPACWLMTSPAFARFRNPTVKAAFLHVYRPVGVNYAYCPEPIHRFAVGYLGWWSAGAGSIGNHGWGIRITIDGDMTVIGI